MVKEEWCARNGEKMMEKQQSFISIDLYMFKVELLLIAQFLQSLG